MLNSTQDKAKSIIVFIIYLVFVAYGPRSQDSSKLVALALAIYSIEYIRTRNKWYEMSIVTILVTLFMFTILPLIIMALIFGDITYFNSETSDPAIFVFMEITLMWLMDKGYQKGGEIVVEEIKKN